MSATKGPRWAWTVGRSLLACVLLLGVPLAFASPPVEAQAAFQSVQALLNGAWNAADWPAVLTILDTMTASETVLARKYQARLNYGWELLAGGQCADAHGQFGRALGLQPGDPGAKLGLATAERRCPEAVLPPAGAITVVAPPAPAAASTRPAPAMGAASSAAVTASPVSSPTRHLVQRGETLFGLARRYGLTVDELARANRLANDALRAGQTLIIPPPSTTPPSSGQTVHTVQPNDTLFSIARRYGTSVTALQQANQLSSDQIWSGQRLVIPAGNDGAIYGTRGVTHRVAPGDTLFSLARRYNTTVEALQAANGLGDYHIVVGSLLIIP